MVTERERELFESDATYSLDFPFVGLDEERSFRKKSVTNKINIYPDTATFYLFNRTTCFDISQVILWFQLVFRTH